MEADIEVLEVEEEDVARIFLSLHARKRGKSNCRAFARI